MAAIEDRFMVSYLLRVVRIGVICTFVVIVPIALYPALTTGAEVHHPVLYYGVVAVTPVSAAIVAVLPWRRMLESRWPMAMFHVWSVGDIVLISLLVAASGGADSTLWAVYTLTTLFFAAAYPRGSQIALFTFTIVAYGVAVAVSSPEPLTEYVGLLVLRAGVLVTVALMAGFISAELTRQMRAQSSRARVASRIAEMAAEIGSLAQRREEVLETTVDAAVDVGFGLVAAVDVTGNTYRIVASYGLPDDFEPVRLMMHQDEHPGPGEVMAVPAERVADPAIAKVLEEARCGAVLATPLTAGPVPVGMLAVGGEDSPTTREAVAMLGTLASNALQNAELYRVKADFVATVSHELRTPLTVLVGMGQTLRRHADRLSSDRVAELAGRIEDNAQRLDALITTLLDFSRFQTEGPRASLERIDLGELVHDVVAHHEHVLAPRVVEVDAPRGVLAVGDAQLLERVVANLLANVAVHTPPSTTARVTVEPDGQHVEVAVSDDGPGISEADAARAMQWFYRGGDHLTRRSSGLGLGLSLAQEILALHDSVLEVGRSDAGGTRMSFRLASAEVQGDVGVVAGRAEGHEVGRGEASLGAPALADGDAPRSTA